MRQIDVILQKLGEPYVIKALDKGDAIYRKLETNFEFEVCIVSSKSCTLYVWSVNPRILIGIYESIPPEYLKDILGYYATLYQKLTGRYRVERQDIEV